MGGLRRAWLYVTDAASFEAARAEGLPAAGLPARGPEEAARAEPGDLIAVYVADAEAFAAAAEVAATTEGARGRGTRIALDGIALCPRGELEPAAPLAPHLTFLKDLTLAERGALPHGALRPIPYADAEQVLFSCRARARGRPRPPGAPPNEAEKPPPIPRRLRHESDGATGLPAS